MSAAEIGAASGIPEQVIVEKFGLRGKHIAGADEHVSDMSVEAASRLLGQNAIDPAEIDVVIYYGSLWKDYPVWQAAPWIAHRLGCENAYALEYANVSCGTPVALRLARNFLLAEPGPPQRPDRRRRPRVAPARLLERALALHVQLRRRRRRRAADARRRPRAARLPRAHRRLLLAPGEGAGRRLGRACVGRERRRPAPLPRRRRSGADEGRARRGQPAELRRRRPWRGRALGCEAGGRVLPLRHPHEALDARGDRRRAGRARARPTSTTPAT